MAFFNEFITPNLSEFWRFMEPMFPRNIKTQTERHHPNPKKQQSTSSIIHQVSMVFWPMFRTEAVVTCSLDYLIRTWDAKSFEMLQDWAWWPFFVTSNRHELVSRNPWLVNTRKASSICYRGFGCCSHAHPHLFVQKNLSISLITKPTTSISTNLCHIHTGFCSIRFTSNCCSNNNGSLNPLQLRPSLNDEEFEGHLNFVNQVARYREDRSGRRIKTCHQKW